MLLRTDGETVIAIGQASHSWISGQLARAWGNARFPAPAPHEEVCLAAEQHDVGMALHDRTPLRDAETGLPLQFHELPRRVHVALWRDAASHLLTQSRYAALLVSMHGTGLYARYPPDVSDPVIALVVEEFLKGQRVLQARLAAEVGASDDELARNQALLAVWDTLSLALCLRWAPRELEHVPSAHGPCTVALTDEGPFHTLDPWPFTADEVVVQAEGRRIDAAGASDEAALHAALEHGEHVPLRFPLRPRS